MVEGNLVAGRQDSPTVYGQSVTDSCIVVEETATVLEGLAHAVAERA
jgi:phospho-2-dehydro-3-deoxyheptonate aldolase